MVPSSDWWIVVTFYDLWNDYLTKTNELVMYISCLPPDHYNHPDSIQTDCLLCPLQKLSLVRDSPLLSRWERDPFCRLATSPPSCLHVSWIYHRLTCPPLPTDRLAGHDLQVSTHTHTHTFIVAYVWDLMVHAVNFSSLIKMKCPYFMSHATSILFRTVKTSSQVPTRVIPNHL